MPTNEPEYDMPSYIDIARNFYIIYNDETNVIVIPSYEPENDMPSHIYNMIETSIMTKQMFPLNRPTSL